MPSLSLSPTAPPALLTSSLQYGIVARSYPLAGKILRGYLDASGTLNGLGIGNPNAEFSPDLTQCALSAEGGTARILWGFRSGAVAVTVANKAMEMSRPTAARWTRCTTDDAHEGPIEHAVWVSDAPQNGGGFFATGGIDGRVKVWDAKRVTCLWTSPIPVNQVVKDPCVKIAVDARGVIAAVLKSGCVYLWTGLGSLFAEEPKEPVPSDVQEVRVPATRTPSVPSPYGDATERQITSFFMHLESPTSVSLLLAYCNEPLFYRHSIDIITSANELVTFGDPSMGAISAICPQFADKLGERSFIATGDVFGSVRIYPWNGRPVSVSASEPLPVGAPTETVVAVRQFEAHNDGAVTAIAWTPSVVLTGSSRGSVKAFDSLTFAPLRDFTSASTRPAPGEQVKQIIVERDFFAAVINNRVVAWRGEPAGRYDHGQSKGKRTAKVPNGLAKWQRKYTLPALSRMRLVDSVSLEQVEMYRDIAESRRELDYEQAHVRRVFGREREQQTTLENLGLSEVEAVEYVLMLSREEDAARRAQDTLPVDDAGVFADSFDEDFQSAAAGTSSDHADRQYANMFTFNGRTYPRAAHSPFSGRVHVSPRLRPEPMEAGSSSPGSQFSLSSSLSSSQSGHGALPVPVGHGPEHFPSISRGSTPTRRSISGSPESVRSAWSTPLRMTRSEGPSSPRAGSSLVSSPAVPAQSPGVSLLSQRFAQARVSEAETGSADSVEDEDLRFAIELSLAEARSRGEDV
ncbi:hypothetical protein EIP86_006911 [Pleurotus ostreatoroseus]|nr:hypothetical protein EIP86_006911 [Pleurotus ostreatoroseus]